MKKRGGGGASLEDLIAQALEGPVAKQGKRQEPVNGSGQSRDVFVKEEAVEHQSSQSDVRPWEFGFQNPKRQRQGTPLHAGTTSAAACLRQSDEQTGQFVKQEEVSGGHVSALSHYSHQSQADLLQQHQALSEQHEAARKLCYAIALQQQQIAAAFTQQQHSAVSRPCIQSYGQPSMNMLPQTLLQQQQQTPRYGNEPWSDLYAADACSPESHMTMADRAAAARSETTVLAPALAEVCKPFVADPYTSMADSLSRTGCATRRLKTGVTLKRSLTAAAMQTLAAKTRRTLTLLWRLGTQANSSVALCAPSRRSLSSILTHSLNHTIQLLQQNSNSLPLFQNLLQ